MKRSLKSTMMQNRKIGMMTCLQKKNWLSMIQIIILIGFPGATTALYLTIRRFVLNGMITRYVGNAGMSAFTASDTLLAIFWAVPLGMANVCRMLMSVSYGEEDRQSLKDVFKTMVGRCLLIQLAMMAVLILLGMFVIAFVIFVMLSLSQNLLNFVVQIFNEVTMR